MSFLLGFNNVFTNTLNNEIQDNLVEFLHWGLLEKGNYFNVSVGETSYNGYDYSRLHISNNENFPQGTAWESNYTNWVWQSGVNYMPPPLVGTNNNKPGVSGVYVDDVFYASDVTGPYSHNIDHFNGRVIFNNEIPTGSKVQAAFSYNYINVIYANSVPWLREVEFDYMTQSKVNSNSIPSEMIVRFPAIAVEISPRRTTKPYQLGRGQYMYTDVLFHCMAENEYTRNSMLDILSFQNDRVINMFDSNTVSANQAFPIDPNGFVNSGALTFPQMVNSYRGGNIFLKNFVSQEGITINSNFYLGIAKFTAETIFY